VSIRTVTTSVHGAGLVMDVIPGDIVLSYRRTWMSALMNVTGDRLSHSGVIALLDSNVVVVEMGHHGLFTRNPQKFASRYRRVAIGRLDVHDECRQAVADEAVRLYRSGRTRYDWRAVFLIGFANLFRRLAPRWAQGVVIRGAHAVAVRHLAALDADTMSCSGFVDRCLSVMCPLCHEPAVWPTRARTPMWSSAPSVTDMRRDPNSGGLTAGVRCLVNPPDLWVSERWEFKRVSDPGLVTHIQDLSDDNERRNAMSPSPK
jgi:hypothetical protein